MTSVRWALALVLVGAPGIGIAPGMAAQETAPLVLRAATSVRGAGFGRAWTAASGPDMIFHNPAQMPARSGHSLSVSRFGAAATLGMLATSTSAGRFALGIGVAWLDHGTFPGGFPVRPAELTVRGPLDATSFAASAAVATTLLGVRAGAAIRYAEDRVDGERSGKASVDIGLARSLGRVTVGLAAQHLGSDISRDGTVADQPARLSASAMTGVIPLGVWFDLVLAAGVTWEWHRDLSPGGGAEIAWVPVQGWTFAARAGVRRVEGDGSPAEHPLSAGASFGVDRFWLDYAFEPVRGTGSIHRVGVRIQ